MDGPVAAPVPVVDALPAPQALVPLPATQSAVAEPQQLTTAKPDTPQAAPQQHSHQHDFDPAAAFECNICLELAKDPIVTLCGHLYCWPCLYRWMQVQTYCRQCPVCKAGIEVDKVVPIYGRGSENPEPHQDFTKLQPLPPRPVAQRPIPVQLAPPMGTTAAPQQQQPQQGMLPALFGFQLGPGQGYVEALTPEQQHQAFLSRLLLMLGSFVIMCLLLF